MVGEMQFAPGYTKCVALFVRDHLVKQGNELLTVQAALDHGTDPAVMDGIIELPSSRLNTLDKRRHELAR